MLRLKAVFGLVLIGKVRTEPRRIFFNGHAMDRIKLLVNFFFLSLSHFVILANHSSSLLGMDVATHPLNISSFKAILIPKGQSSCVLVCWCQYHNNSLASISQMLKVSQWWLSPSSPPQSLLSPYSLSFILHHLSSLSLLFFILSFLLFPPLSPSLCLPHSAISLSLSLSL